MLKSTKILGSSQTFEHSILFYFKKLFPHHHHYLSKLIVSFHFWPLPPYFLHSLVMHDFESYLSMSCICIVCILHSFCFQYSLVNFLQRMIYARYKKCYIHNWKLHYNIVLSGAINRSESSLCYEKRNMNLTGTFNHNMLALNWRSILYHIPLE